MFKKPKRNFRARRTRGSESGDENEAKDTDTSSSLADSGGPFGFEIPRENTNSVPVKKVKKKRPTEKPVAGPAGATVLSFDVDTHEDGAEVFKVKKSSRSRHIAKQLKKESRRDKEEREKREAAETVQQQQVQEVPRESNGSAATVEMAETELPSELDRSPTESPDLAGEEGSGDSDERHEREEKKKLCFDRIFESGQIPDANMIHMARKRRQQAREMGDFVPLDEKERFKESSSRLIREEDHDHSDDEDEPLSFSVNRREQELRKMQDTILAAEEGSHSEDSDQEREWVEQQIRKGVSIPQVPVTTTSSQQTNSTNSNNVNYQQYIYSQSSNIFNRNAPDFKLGFLSQPSGNKVPRVPKIPSAEMSPISMSSVKKRLQDRLDDLTSVHRAHVIEHEDIKLRLETCESSITQCENSQSGLEDQYRFFQEMRGYVRDLLECLNEKVPSINYLERSMNHHLKARAERLIKRRQDDVKDQAKDCRAMTTPNLLAAEQLDPEKQRRVAEREARRSRRRRARENLAIKDHHEGLSTDDEENQSEITKFRVAREQIEYDCETMYNDVNDEFCKLDLIRRQFETWKYNQSGSYEEAYIGLCLPKLLRPFITPSLICWNPLDAKCCDFEETSWYESLMFYGYREGEALNREDSDIKLMPSVIEKVLLPKLTGLVEDVWDPLSSKQTIRLAAIAKRLVADYPTVTADSKNTQTFIRSLVCRLQRTLGDDVFVPLYPKQVMENRSSGAYIFFQRQFWSCVKLLTNLVIWHGVVSDRVLKELVLDGLLNRYLLLALQTSAPSADTLYKCHTIVSTLPKAWFANLMTDSTLPQLEMLCRYLTNTASTLATTLATVNEAEKKDCRESLRQITKMLVTIHAMDHALALSGKFSISSSYLQKV